MEDREIILEDYLVDLMEMKQDVHRLDVNHFHDIVVYLARIVQYSMMPAKGDNAAVYVLFNCAHWYQKSLKFIDHSK